MIPTSEIRPKAVWYWVGGAIMAFGVIAAIGVFAVAFKEPFEEFQELDRQIDDMQRFPVPGEGTVVLEGTGEFVIYAEGPGIAANLGTFEPFEVTVEPIAGEPTEVEVRSVFIDETYDFGGPAGRASVEFTITDPGEYLITIDSAPAGVDDAAVGRRVDVLGAVGSIALAIVVPMGVGGLFLVIGGVVLIVTGVQRSGSAKRLRQAAAPMPPQGAWGQPGPWGGPAHQTWPPPGTPGAPGAPGVPGQWGAAPPPPPPAPAWPPPTEPPSGPPPPPR